MPTTPEVEAAIKNLQIALQRAEKTSLASILAGERPVPAGVAISNSYTGKDGAPTISLRDEKTGAEVWIETSNENNLRRSSIMAVRPALGETMKTAASFSEPSSEFLATLRKVLGSSTGLSQCVVGQHIGNTSDVIVPHAKEKHHIEKSQ